MMPNKFGVFVAEKRKEKELSLRKMAELLEFSPAYWSDIEKGRRNPPNLSKIEEIAKLLSLSQEEKEAMIDMASEDRNEIPMDLLNISKTVILPGCLRKARKKDETRRGNDITEKA